jgi:hypothetical protein
LIANLSAFVLVAGRPVSIAKAESILEHDGFIKTKMLFRKEQHYEVYKSVLLNQYPAAAAFGF